MNKTLSLLPVLMMLVLAGCATTSIRQHPSFSASSADFTSVAILPIEAEVVEIKFTGENQPLLEEQKAVEDLYKSSVVSVLKEKGYEPQWLDLEALAEQDPDFQFNLEQLKKTYRGSSNVLYKTALMPKEKANTLQETVGDTITNVAYLADTDTILLSFYNGFKKSSGQKTKEMASAVLIGVLTGSAPVPVPYGGSMELALINANSGDILWTNAKGLQLNHEQIVQQLLKTFPSKLIDIEEKPAEVIGEKSKTQEVI